MAIQTVKYGFPFPPWPTDVTQAPALATATLDASGEKYANICTASAAKAIHKVHLRTSTVTVGDTMDVRVETVDSSANGDPTGTLWATNTNASLVIANGDDSVWKTATLTADATVARGDVFALVVVNGSAGNMLIVSYDDQAMNFPYSDLYASATWTKDVNAAMIIPEYSDGSFEPIYGHMDMGALINSRTFKSDDATNRRGNIFQLPFPAQANGAWAWVDADAGFTIKLYDSDGTSVLATTASANAFQRVAATPLLHFLPFTTTASLSANTNYRLQVVPDTTSNIVVYDYDVVSAAMLDSFPGGQNCHRSVYTSSAWVETTTARSYLGVFLDGFDDGAGGGGGGMLRHPGMNGGLV